MYKGVLTFAAIVDDGKDDTGAAPYNSLPDTY